MVPRLFGLSNWKDGFVVHRDGKGCVGVDDASKSGFLVDSWTHESGINGNIRG